MRVSFLVIVLCAALALTLGAYGCKKKEEAVPTAETAVETAGGTAQAEVPGPGDDLICNECKTLFTTDEEYAAHMESQHPAEWAKIKDRFYELRAGTAESGAK